MAAGVCTCVAWLEGSVGRLTDRVCGKAHQYNMQTGCFNPCVSGLYSVFSCSQTFSYADSLCILGEMRKKPTSQAMSQKVGDARHSLHSVFPLQEKSWTETVCLYTSLPAWGRVGMDRVKWFLVFSIWLFLTFLLYWGLKPPN